MNSCRITRLLVFTLVAAASNLQAQVPNPGSEGKLRLEWLKDYPEALRCAEAEKKPLLIDVTTDWCGWSKKMERETFADLVVQKELRSFILIRINPEVSDKNQKIADSFGADSYPTLVVANFRGEPIAQNSGYMNGKEFLEFLRRYLPMFKGNPLGYKSVQLEANDPLMKAIQKIPSPDSRPATLGSFVVLDQSTMLLQADGSSKVMVRTATFIADPEKGELPDASRSYVSSRQKFKFKTVRIVNTKGAGREVDVKLAKDEHAYSNQNIYWDTRAVSLELPPLKEGEILDVVEEREFQPVMPHEFYFRWFTAPKILLSSDLTIIFPPSLNLQKRAVRCTNPVTETKNPDGTITWNLKTSNAKAYEPALFSPPLIEVWEGYDFYTPCTKDAVAAWFTGLCQGRDVLPPGARQKVAALKRAHASQTALLQALMDWVTKDIRYVSVAFGAASHQPHPVSDTLSNLYGDCKDQSLLVQSLCREAGLPASLVLVDAYGEGFDETALGIELFNHCIVEATADGKTYYLDAAAGPAKLGRLPHSYSGSTALKIEGTTGRTVILPPYQPLIDQELSSTVIKLSPNGSATVTETAQYAGEKAALMKERTKNTSPEKMRQYFETTYKRNGRKLLDFYMTDTNSTGDKYETRIAYAVPRFGSMTAGGIAFKLAGTGQTEEWIDALNLPRTQPFRFRSTDSVKSTFTVELPAGTALKGRPQDLEIDAPFMKANRKIQFKDNQLSATETSRLLEARLAPSQAGKVYEAFRQLYEHREYSYIVDMSGATATAAQPTTQSASAPTAPQGAARMLRLNGISGSAPNRLAIINGKTLAAGESASVKADGRSFTVHCVSIGERSASVSIEGVNGTTELELKD
jgi:transglutaminase-like putative cysteine protease/thioredoxin-related protein